MRPCYNFCRSATKEETVQAKRGNGRKRECLFMTYLTTLSESQPIDGRMLG